MIALLTAMAGTFCIGWAFGYLRGHVEGRLRGRAEILRERTLR